MAGRTFQVEHAKSNRSKCKKCKEKLDKGELRIGVVVDRDDDYAMTSWHCCQCFGKIKFRVNPPKSGSDLSGFNALSAAEKKLVRKAVWPSDDDSDSESESGSESKSESESESDSEPITKLRSKRPNKRKRADTDDDSDSDSDAAAAPPKAKRVKKIAIAEIKQMKVVDLRSELAKRDLSKSGNKKQLIDRLVKANKASPASSSASSSKAKKAELEFKKRYNADKKLADEWKEDLRSETVESLKNMLRHNQMKLGGNKSEVINRIIDAKLYGTLPRCPDCGSGRLGVSYKKGKNYGHKGEGDWKCPGFMDDDTFMRCSYRTSGAVDRPKWKELDE